jgi:hypothetical protein
LNIALLAIDSFFGQRVTTKRVIGDIGVEASTVVDAWPLGVDLRQKPLYSITASGDDPRVVNNDLLVISRGLEEVDWWSVYNVEKGAHLFDTYVPLVQFSIARDTQVLRYVGFEVPPDDTTDSRLKGTQRCRRADLCFCATRHSRGVDHVRRFEAGAVAPFFRGFNSHTYVLGRKPEALH